MAYGVVATAVTGDIVPAAWGNRVRDNSAYLKGQAGAVTIESGMNIPSVDIQSRSQLRGPNGAAAGFWYAGTDGTNRHFIGINDADSTLWRIYGSLVGDVLSFKNDGQMIWMSVNDINTGIPPTRLRRVTRAGMLGAGGGTQSLAYNGDGTLFYIHYPDGINATTTITFEYSGGQVVAIRLRDGGSGGTILNSVTFGYSGGQVTSIAQS